MKILNLYACLGGNRYKWDEAANDAGIEIQVTAVELDPFLAELYKERFPNDTIIIADAHQFLLDKFKEFDFIWSSPPCPTHSRARYWGSKGGTCDIVYPDISLYQEVILLQNFYEGKFCVENVIGYYEPLIPAKKRGRHYYWTNFELPNILSNRKDVSGNRGKNEIIDLSKFHDYDFYKYKGSQHINKIARNLVDYEQGKTILEIAIGSYIKKNKQQYSLF